jgi:hypothetical protein
VHGLLDFSDVGRRETGHENRRKYRPKSAIAVSPRDKIQHAYILRSLGPIS